MQSYEVEPYASNAVRAFSDVWEQDHGPFFQPCEERVTTVIREGVPLFPDVIEVTFVET